MIARIRLAATRALAFLRSGAGDRDFAEELESHLAMMTEENIRRGMPPEEARRQAAVRLGGVSSLASQHRDARSLPALEDLLQDLRFALRLILKERWFSAAAIAAIALGIGANTVGFTIVNAAFIRGFSFERADRLHAISWRTASGRRTSSSYADFQEWRAQTKTFSDVAAYSFGAINISDDNALPEQTQGASVSANHFEVLRQRPLLGRAFAAGDDDRDADLVVVIGYDIWRNRYGSDPGVLGRTLRVNGRPGAIIGVMPERMKFPDNSEMWVPLVPTDAQLARDARTVGVFGRLADDASRQSAESELEGLSRQIRSAHPDQTRDLAGVRIETFIQRFLGGAARPMFITVMGAVIFVLLIACANVANLLLSRAMYRSREIAVRYSLGATRWRIVRQLLIESVTLSLLGGSVGLVLAAFGVQAFDAAVQMSQPPYWLSFTIDYRVLAYVAGICVATGVIFGLAPALHVSSGNQHETLKEGARGTVGNRRAGRFGNGLVIAELALTVVLLCGAGLMLRSFIALYAVDPGINLAGLMRMRMQLPPSSYPTADSRLRFFEELGPRIESIPGIEAAAFTTSVPPLDDEERRFEIDGRPAIDEDRRPFVGTVTISPSYFAVLGARVTRGREFNTIDGADGSENVIVSQVFADRFFPAEDPIGKRIRFNARGNDGKAPPESWRTIVGVSGRFLQGSADEAFRSAVVYLPFRQAPPRTSSLLIRSSLPPAVVMADVRRAVQSVDVDQPVFTIQAVAEIFEEERLIYRIFATLFAVLAGIALALSAVGVYGVMAYAVTQRTQEIGVRMAIGAQRSQVSWLFLKRGLAQLALGLAIGLPAALALASIARFRLVEVEPSDPVTMIGITLVLAVVAFASCLLPVRKAARIDPVVALRSE